MNVVFVRLRTVILWLGLYLLVLSHGFCQRVPSDRTATTKAVMGRLAADLHALTAKSSASSVYILTNKDIYECGEDLWFKAHVLHAQTFQPAVSDSILYLTLQRCDSDSLYWQEMYPVTDGIATGHVYLDLHLPEGDYWLKGYSSHSAGLTGPLFYACRKISIIKDLASLLSRSSNSPSQQPGSTKQVVFSIMPEGGQLIAGQHNTLAFKVIDKTGKPVNFRGQLFEDYRPLAGLQTTHDGMGKIDLIPSATARYSVKPLQPAIDTLYPLPDVHQSGMSLHIVHNSQDTLVVSVIAASSDRKETIYVRLQVRGQVQAMASATLTERVTLKFPLQHMPQGIAGLTFFDEQLRPHSGRLVYLRHADRLYIDCQLRKDTFALREKVTLSIKTTDQHGRPLPAAVGLTVFDNLYETYGQTAIDTYYFLTTQLRGTIHNPHYYFDENNRDRAEALDLLLLTQGWHRYTWQDDNLRAGNRSPLTLQNHIQGKLLQTGKTRKGTPAQSFILAFNNAQTEKVMIPLEPDGSFRITPAELNGGRRLYLKHFGDNRQYKVQLEAPFAAIVRTASFWQPVYPAVTVPSATDRLTGIAETERARYTLNEVTVRAKNTTGFRDKYLGSLDSLANLDGPADYVGICGLLNCPACGSGTKPVEGKQYSEYIGNRRNQITTHPFAFSGNEMQRITYHYRHYSEEELLAKFNLVALQGFYSHKAFYEPTYDQVPESTPDNRNTLTWQPVIRTNQHGEAIVSFFTSDNQGQYTGCIEGITSDGLAGKKDFLFQVQRRTEK